MADCLLHLGRPLFGRFGCPASAVQIIAAAALLWYAGQLPGGAKMFGRLPPSVTAGRLASNGKRRLDGAALLATLAEGDQAAKAPVERWRASG
ncbi:MAG: hypothetical protein ACLT1A_12140 [Dysosmobacter sp.]